MSAAHAAHEMELDALTLDKFVDVNVVRLTFHIYQMEKDVVWQHRVSHDYLVEGDFAAVGFAVWVIPHLNDGVLD